jgi:hypothetical protein
LIDRIEHLPNWEIDIHHRSTPYLYYQKGTLPRQYRSVIDYRTASTKSRNKTDYE